MNCSDVYVTADDTYVHNIPFFMSINESTYTPR